MDADVTNIYPVLYNSDKQTAVRLKVGRALKSALLEAQRSGAPLRLKVEHGLRPTDVKVGNKGLRVFCLLHEIEQPSPPCIVWCGTVHHACCCLSCRLLSASVLKHIPLWDRVPQAVWMPYYSTMRQVLAMLWPALSPPHCMLSRYDVTP